jgi:hypothetical protein
LTPANGQGELTLLEALPIVRAQEYDYRRIGHAEVIARCETKREYLAGSSKRARHFDEANLG